MSSNPELERLVSGLTPQTLKMLDDAGVMQVSRTDVSIERVGDHSWVRRRLRTNDEPDHRPMQRAVWRLRNVEGLTDEEIAIIARCGRYRAFERLRWSGSDGDLDLERSLRKAKVPPSEWPRRAKPAKPFRSNTRDQRRITDYLRHCPGKGVRELQRAEVLQGVKVKGRVEAALRVLLESGQIRYELGPRGVHRHYIVEPVLEADLEPPMEAWHPLEYEEMLEEVASGVIL